MEKRTIYIIHRYVNGEMIEPLAYKSKETAYKKFKEFGDVLKIFGTDSVQEWDEVGGKEITSKKLNTIYRLCEHTQLDENMTIAYMDIEDDKMFHIANVALTTYTDGVDMVKAFVAETEKKRGIKTLYSEQEHAVLISKNNKRQYKVKISDIYIVG